MKNIRISILSLFLGSFFNTYSQNIYDTSKIIGEKLPMEQCEYVKQTYSDNAHFCSTNQWTCIFEDNFNGTNLSPEWMLPYQGYDATLVGATSKQWFWNTLTPGTSQDPILPMSNNIVIEDGKLKLIVRKEDPPIEGVWVTDWNTVPVTTETSFFDYSSAEILSRFTFGYGCYEGRIKVPTGRGFWPAFWTWGERKSELDFFEFMSSDDDPDAEMHRVNMHFDFDNIGTDNNNCPTHDEDHDYSSDFFEYTTYYLQGFTIFRVNGVDEETYYCYKDGTYLTYIPCDIYAGTPYFRAKFYPYPTNFMRIRLGVGVQVDPWKPEDYSVPQAMETDYIKFYRQYSCEDIVIEENNKVAYPIVPQYYNSIIGNSVELNCNYIVPSNERLVIKADQGIFLKPGFIAEYGTFFNTILDPNLCVDSPNPVTSLDLKNSINSATNDTDQITIYPNPAQNSFTIKIINKTYERLRITNVFGVEVYSSKIMNNLICVSSNWQSGIYFVNFISNNETCTRKVVID